MRLAIREGRRNLRVMEGGPFGACIVKNNRVLSVARNMVLKKDATRHAEINAIRAASRKIGSFDLSGCHIYSTTEPCPMCFSAIHWARIAVIAYGTSIRDVKRLGFNELYIPTARMKALGKSKVRIFPDFLLEDCLGLLRDWNNLQDKIIY